MEVVRVAGFFVFAFALLAYFLPASQAYTFYVGGKDGWGLKLAQKYNDWAERNRFQINDTLGEFLLFVILGSGYLDGHWISVLAVFKYEKGSDSVLWVSKEGYESCKTANPIQKFDDGNTEFKFQKSGPYFFISGEDGNCGKGERLIVVVLAERHHLKPNPGQGIPPPPSANHPPGASTPSESPASMSPLPSSTPPSSLPSPIAAGPSPAATPVTPPTSESPLASSPPSASPLPSPAATPESPPRTHPPFAAPGPSPSAETAPPSPSGPVASPMSAPVAPPISVSPTSAPVSSPLSGSPVSPPVASPLSVSPISAPGPSPFPTLSPTGQAPSLSPPSPVAPSPPSPTASPPSSATPSPPSPPEGTQSPSGSASASPAQNRSAAWVTTPTSILAFSVPLLFKAALL